MVDSKKSVNFIQSEAELEKVMAEEVTAITDLNPRMARTAKGILIFISLTYIYNN